MRGKLFKFGKDGRESLFTGIEILANAVTTTLGPKGRNVILDKMWITPTILHDGVSVANDVDFSEPFANMGSQIVKEAAGKTNDKVGDGTTTSTLLAYSIIKTGMVRLNDGHNPMTLKKGIDLAVTTVVAELDKIKEDVSTREKMEQVATVSAASNEIGAMVARAIDKVGKYGVVTIEEGMGTGLELKTTLGLEIDKGYTSPRFVNDEDKMEVNLENPYVLVSKDRITSAQDLVMALKQVTEVAKRSEVVVIADGYDEGVMATLVLNKLHGGLQIVALNPPAFSERRYQILEDIAVVTGATMLDTKGGTVKLDEMKLEHFGMCERFFCDKDRSQFIGGIGQQATIDKRISQIGEEIKKEKSDFEISKLKERQARLGGGVGIIKVGAQTELEMKERKERVIDALEATKSAVEAGVVAGGGVALLWARESLKSLKKSLKAETVRVGVDIVYEALGAPIEKILTNAGLDSKDIVTNLVGIYEADPQKAGRWGYDVETEKYGDLFQLGILDPLKVTRSALQNAASIGSMFLTSEAFIAFAPEERKEATPKE